MKGEAGRSERLFRAAVSAFCSLTRPLRRDIKQLEDLVLPLFDTVSVEARRFAAAALSECADAPGVLIRRLSNEAVDIAAPLLIRSKILRDVDLIALIGRHGLPHARAIARRADLNPAIADLVWALENPKLVRLPLPKERQAQMEAANRAQALNDGNLEPVPGSSADNARRRLRSMMVSAQTVPDATTEQPAGSLRYTKLREMALTGNPALFQTALADASDIDFPTAKSIIETGNYSELTDVLRSLELSEEQAFLIAACVCPGKFADPEAIRLFLYSYRNIQPNTTRQTLKTGSPSTPVPLQNTTRSAAS